MSTSRIAAAAALVAACAFVQAAPAGGSNDEIFTYGFELFSQTVIFVSPAPSDAKVAGTPYVVNAISTSGRPVDLTIDATAATVCSISGATVSFLAAGTCVIDGNQSGDANYGAAPQAQQVFAVGKGDQTITFSTSPSGNEVVNGASYVVAATSNSGLPVSFGIAAGAASICTLNGNTVSFQGAGNCVIVATQGGDADWGAAQAQQSFAVGRGAQTISFTSNAPGNANVGGASYTVAATASSGLPVAFSIDASANAVCAVAGNTVTFAAQGTCVVDADQPGDGNWNAAPRVQQSFAVNGCLNLAVGQVVLDVMPSGANFCVTNSAASNAEYTWLPMNLDAADIAGLSISATNIVAVSGPPSPIQPEGMLGETGDTEAALGAHAPSLPIAADSAARIDAVALIRPNSIPQGPLAVGQLIDLNTTIGDCSAALDVRKGRVEAITTPQSPGQQKLYAVQEVVETTPGAGDWHPPLAGGFGTQEFQNIIDGFAMQPSDAAPLTPGGAGALGGLLKAGAMDTLTKNFGALTDLDNNGGVIVFFTRKLNELVPSGGAPVIASFQTHDLFNKTTCPASNEGEILYMMVPDTVGMVNSNVRTVGFVYGNSDTQLTHHMEHLDNAWRRAYVTGASALEETWLDEALAWEAQELVFFNASHGLSVRNNVVVTNLTTGPFASVRVNDYNSYMNPIYLAMRDTFFRLGSANGNARVGPLRSAGITADSAIAHDQVVQSFSITSQFLRYAVDRVNGNDAAVFNSLVDTPLTGMANLQHAIGANPLDWVRDFNVAIYVDDAGINVAPQYTIPSWSYRSLHSALFGSYQLAVDPLSDGVGLTFQLRCGGGSRYARFGVAPGQAANVLLTSGGVAPTSAIATGLVRTK